MMALKELRERVEALEKRQSLSHDSLAAHCNEISAQYAGLLERIKALERKKWWMFWRKA